MTYPDDVLKAAREAAATDEENRAEAEKAAGNLAGHSWHLARPRGYRNGKYDSEEKVAAACIAVMAGQVLSGFNDGDGADVEAVLETTCDAEWPGDEG